MKNEYEYCSICEEIASEEWEGFPNSTEEALWKYKYAAHLLKDHFTFEEAVSYVPLF